MAPLSKLIAFAAGLGLSSAHKRDRSDFLSAVQSGAVPKSKVELVLAQHDEDIAWSEPYRSVRTVYCKGSSCGSDAAQLPNVGREGHTFLHHIVENYDNLADWTVFSQAERPNEGYFGHGMGGGHLLTGSTIEDFLVHNDETEGKDDSLFLMTSKVHLPSMAHSLRSAFKTGPNMETPSMNAHAMCPQEIGDVESEDVWSVYRTIPSVKHFLENKCGVDESTFAGALEAFWQDFVQLPMPVNKVVHYAQGARFAVSRARLQQRSKDFYQTLLRSISDDQDPCLNYLFEWSWYYILGHPTTEPCAATLRDAEVTTAEARMLERTTGVSGVSGDPVEPEDMNETMIINGSFIFQIAPDVAEDFVANESNREALEESLADVLKIPREWVNATMNITTEGPPPGSMKRLLRQLQAESVNVKVDYMITLPATKDQMDMEPVHAQTVMDMIMDDRFKDELEMAMMQKTGHTIIITEVIMPMMDEAPEREHEQEMTTTTKPMGMNDGMNETETMIVEGSFTFMIPQDVVEDYVANESNREALEVSLAGATMVPREWVKATMSITDSSPPPERRLRQLATEGSANVMVDYTITIPADQETEQPIHAQTVVDNIMGEGFKDAVQNSMEEKTGHAIVVTEVKMPMTKEAPETTTTEAPAAAGAATRISGLFALACVAAANLL